MSTSRSSYTWPIISVLVAALIALIAAPSSWKTWAPAILQAPRFHLGLDLAGGTQLDFRISEEELTTERARLQAELVAAQERDAGAEAIAALRLQIETIDQQQTNLVEAIRNVLERRLNGLGVNETTITPSYVGNEKHLLVDCSGIVDVQLCIDTVGKTITLEFKEEFTQATDEFRAGVRTRAEALLARVTTGGETLEKVGQDVGTELGTSYQNEAFLFRDELPKGLESLWTRAPLRPPVLLEGSLQVPQMDARGQLTMQEAPALFLAEVTGPRTQTGRVLTSVPEAFKTLAESDATLTARLVEDQSLNEAVSVPLATSVREQEPGTTLEAVDLGDGTAALVSVREFTEGQSTVPVSHILVGYAGAQKAEAGVTRTKEEALARAQELKTQLDGGASFEELATTASDAPSKTNRGSLGAIARGDVAPTFEDVAFSALPGVVSAPIETAYGYHLIRVDGPVSRTPDVASYDLLTVTGDGAVARATALKEQVEAGEVRRSEEAVPLRLLVLSLTPSGWRDTALDGKRFRSAAVTTEPTTGLPVVQISFDEEGARLFADLTQANVGKRIAIFVGGELVTAPTVQQAITSGVAIITGSRDFREASRLAQDLNTGSIPAPIYLSGQRTIEPTLGAQALQMSLEASLIGLVLTVLYLVLMYRLLGVVASVALGIYGILFIALMKLPLFLVTDTYVVLTLAGIAGMILSIGMSVDLNVLIFERMREEMRRGKSFRTAAELGFERAWSSIRDSNMSTLITCAILFTIGTSIVRGFAVTLALGIVVSLITGVTITRWLVMLLARTKLAERPSLFGVRK
jgi:protein-export membrane protein SecD